MATAGVVNRPADGGGAANVVAAMKAADRIPSITVRLPVIREGEKEAWTGSARQGFAESVGRRNLGFQQPAHLLRPCDDGRAVVARKRGIAAAADHRAFRPSTNSRSWSAAG